MRKTTRKKELVALRWYHGAMVLLALLDNEPCIVMVAEAKSALECEASWFSGWQNWETLGAGPFPSLGLNFLIIMRTFDPSTFDILCTCDSVRFPERDPFLCCVQERAGGRKLGIRRPIFFLPPTNIPVLSAAK